MLDTTSPPAARLRQPRWLDIRLLAGLILVLASVVIGVRVVASASGGELVWQVGADLAAGTPLAEDDIRAVDVRLGAGSAASYLDASGPKPVGWVLVRPVGARELLPRAAVAPPDSAAEHWRIVTVPVQRFHYPGDLAKGEQVDVYVTVAAPPTVGDAVAAYPELVLRAVTVARVDAGTGGLAVASGAAIGVELAVPQADAEVLVRAGQSGALDLVRVPVAGAGGR